jgi:outer membrane protein assembly factor BamB
LNNNFKWSNIDPTATAEHSRAYGECGLAILGDLDDPAEQPDTDVFEPFRPPGVLYGDYPFMTSSRPNRIIDFTSRCCGALGLIFAAGCALALVAGCQSGTKPAESSASASTGASSVNVAAPAPVITDMDRSHVIGPTAARELDYRIAWQHLGAGRTIKIFTVQGDSVFFLDMENFLARIKIADGNRLWRMQIADPIEEVYGVTYPGDRVYVTTGGSVLVLDPNTGSQIQRQELLQIANTEPALFNQYLIYGSRNGQVVWHSRLVGQHWRGYQIAPAMLVPPVVEGDVVAAVGNNGSVYVLSATTTRQYWNRTLLAPVLCQPAIGEAALYVAGTDQYLWAFDLNSGRNLWKVLHESQLVDSPVLVGERLYQQVPRAGLHCYTALPSDDLDGDLIWKTQGVNGNVLLQRRSELITWDRQGRRMIVVDAERGSIIKTLDLPAVTRLVAAGPNRDEIYAANDDGRVVRLVPRK